MITLNLTFCLILFNTPEVLNSSVIYYLNKNGKLTWKVRNELEEH